MRIVNYEELRDPRDFFELLEACFGEVAAPQHPNLLRRLRRPAQEAFSTDCRHRATAKPGDEDWQDSSSSG
jgi:hypothetical protein